MYITQHTRPTDLRPIRMAKQLWLSVLLKDTSAAIGQVGIRTHILTSTEFESNALDRSAMTLKIRAARMRQLFVRRATRISTNQSDKDWHHAPDFGSVFVCPENVRCLIIITIFLTFLKHLRLGPYRP